MYALSIYDEKIVHAHMVQRTIHLKNVDQKLKHKIIGKI
jgi:hypothetical protein